jgi:general secretion pathway protein E
VVPIELSKKDIKEKGLTYFPELTHRYLEINGTGLKSESDVHYLCVLQDRSQYDQYYIILTRTTYMKARFEVEAIQQDLLQKFSAKTINIAYVTVEIVESYLTQAIRDKTSEDSESKSKRDSTEDTSAKKRFREWIERALQLGAADIDFIVRGDQGSIGMKVNGKMRPREAHPAQTIRRMINAMLQTESENSRGHVEDKQILSRTTVLEVSPTINNRKEPQIVRLRGLKSYAHDGFTYSARIIQTKQEDSRNIGELGFPEESCATLRYLARQPSGIILIVGPTGHGKTVTLKALYEDMPIDYKLLVIEDPVEYLINHPNCIQEEVIDELGLSVNAYKKASLRQFPNVIGISEIRDEAVANEVIQSALSGHLMVSTMHTHDTLSTPERLNQMGVSYQLQAQPGLVRGYMSQRLLPRLCSCAISGPKDTYWGDNHRKIKPGGCAKCGGTGIMGRAPVMETIVFTDATRKILATGDLNALEAHLRNNGWLSMLDRGLAQVKAGNVDPEDLINMLGDPRQAGNSEYQYGTATFEAVE